MNKLTELLKTLPPGSHCVTASVLIDLKTEIKAFKDGLKEKDVFNGNLRAFSWGRTYDYIIIELSGKYGNVRAEIDHILNTVMLSIRPGVHLFIISHAVSEKSFPIVLETSPEVGQYFSFHKLIISENKTGRFAHISRKEKEFALNCGENYIKAYKNFIKELPY